MTDIRTTTEEFAVSGSLVKVKEDIIHEDPQYDSQEAVQFLAKKVDELIEEVNILKNA